MDSVLGVKKISIYKDLKNFEESPRNSVHDFDLPVFLGLMLKLKKIKSFKIVGIPTDYYLEKAVDEVSKLLKRI